MSASSPLRAAAAALLALAASACTTAAASPPPLPVSRDAGSTGAALAILDRVAAEQHAVPDVVGRDVAGAAAALESLGATVHVVALDASGAVTAQYPAAGDALPVDARVTVWLGTPPSTPPLPVAPRAPEAPTAEAAPQDGTAAAAEPGGAADAAPPAPAPQEPPAPPAATAPQAPQPPLARQGATPGLVAPDGPPPPRSNIRTLPPAPAGTALHGRASWYGPGFAGLTTACGGTFDPGALTLATRELRCGTTVTVSGPGGRTVQATVTDWGPAEWTGRRFDLSAATFAAIAHPGTGVVDVTVTVR